METWTTNSLPQNRQYKAWCDRLAEGGNPARARRNGGDDAPFPAEVSLAKVGTCDLLTVKAPPHWVELRSRASAGVGSYFAVYLFSAANVGTPQSRIELPAGSVVLLDPSRNENIESTAGIHYVSIRIPRKMLDAHVPPNRWADQVVALREQECVGALVSSYVKSMVLGATDFTAHHVDTVVDTLCRLLALGIKNGDPERTDDKLSVRAARLVRVKRVIKTKLSDPELSPSTLATALGMSSRNLHLLFQDSGETFAEYVMARRLEACRAALGDSTQPARSVTDIAFDWGFSNLTTFYRAFKATYNMTPKEARAWAETDAA